MVVVRASGFLFDHQIQYPAWEPTADRLRHWIRELGVGGVILLGGSAAEVGLRSHQLQDWATIPLLMAADVEEGVGQRFSGATWFPPPMALGAIAQTDIDLALSLAEAMGAATVREAVAIGLNWVLAPVVDVNNNPANPVINVRSFGETPDRVRQLIAAFIQGAQTHPVLTTAKHFPGHGDTEVDSHLDLPVLPHTRDRLDTIELPPFAAAIAAGVDTVMTAHLRIPSLDSTYPATLSPTLLTGELRQRLGFDGLIVTDALIMGAIANGYGANEAAVLAVAAGADVLLMPADPEGAIAAVVEAVETGRIPPERIQASLERIWRAKHKIMAPAIQGSTSHAWEAVPPPPLDLNAIAQPETWAIVTQTLRQSMRVYQPAISRLTYPPLPGPPRTLIVVDEIVGCPFLGRTSPAIALLRQRGYEVHLIDRHTPLDGLTIATPQTTLLQLFIRGTPFRGTAGLSDRVNQLVHHLVSTNQLQALLLYGSPYSLEAVLPHLPADVPYGFTYGQMDVAQQLMLAALFDGAPEHRGSDRQFTD